jgi:hypothetical protein
MKARIISIPRPLDLTSSGSPAKPSMAPGKRLLRDMMLGLSNALASTWPSSSCPCSATRKTRRR